MSDIHDVTKINYKSDYVFYVEFEDGLSGEIDFFEYISKGPIFKPFENLNYFKNASIEGGTISWANGADIAPETLYEKLCH